MHLWWFFKSCNDPTPDWCLNIWPCWSKHSPESVSIIMHIQDTGFALKLFYKRMLAAKVCNLTDVGLELLERKFELFIPAFFCPATSAHWNKSPYQSNVTLCLLIGPIGVWVDPESYEAECVKLKHSQIIFPDHGFSGKASDPLLPVGTDGQCLIRSSPCPGACSRDNRPAGERGQ